MSNPPPPWKYKEFRQEVSRVAVILLLMFSFFAGALIEKHFGDHPDCPSPEFTVNDNVQVFYNHGLWYKPDNAREVRVVLTNNNNRMDLSFLPDHLPDIVEVFPKDSRFGEYAQLFTKPSRIIVITHVNKGDAMTPEEEAELVKQKQRDCEHHPQSIVLSMSGTIPQCVHCGMTKSDWEEYNQYAAARISIWGKGGIP